MLLESIKAYLIFEFGAKRMSSENKRKIPVEVKDEGKSKSAAY